MNTLKQLEAAPRNLILYVWSLLGAVVDDYALITLVIFSVLLGFVTTALIAVTAFFGLYFVLRLVVNVAGAIGSVGQAVTQVAAVQAQVAQRQPRSAPLAEFGPMLETDPQL